MTYSMGIVLSGIGIWACINGNPYVMFLTMLLLFNVPSAYGKEEDFE